MSGEDKINFLIPLDELEKMRIQLRKTRPEELEKWIEAFLKENNKLENKLRKIQKELEHILNETKNNIELCESFMIKIKKEFAEKSSNLDANKIRLRDLTIDFDIWKLMRDLHREYLNKFEYFKREITQ